MVARLTPGAMNAVQNRSEVLAVVPYHPIDLRGVVAYAVVLLFVAMMDDVRPFGLDWFGAGRVHTELVRDSEWWRPRPPPVIEA